MLMKTVHGQSTTMIHRGVRYTFEGGVAQDVPASMLSAYRGVLEVVGNSNEAVGLAADVYEAADVIKLYKMPIISVDDINKDEPKKEIKKPSNRRGK
jgi:hypothetical protein